MATAAELGVDLAVTGQGQVALRLELIGSAGDLVTVSAEENLRQAIWLRLVTEEGELTNLGHPDYGSRLHLLVGRLPGPEVLALARAYVREALRREPRIEQVESVSVTQDPLQPDRLLITATVKPAGDVAPLNLAFAFSTDRSVAGE
jgi:phage baseplate assembly protein W